MSPWTRFFGIAGLVLVGFSVIGAGIVGADFAVTNPLILGHFVVGVVLILYWILTSGIKNIGAAGRAATGRSARFGAYAVISVALFLGILGAVNWIANRYDKRWDLTEAGVYSLAPQSAEIIRGLKKPLKLVGLSGATLIKMGKNPEGLKSLFDLYRNANPDKVSVELFDPQAKPHLVEKYGYKSGTLIYIEYGEEGSKGVSRINDESEEAVTNAILKLQNGEAKKVYYLSGHDEPALNGNGPEGFKKVGDAIGDEHLTIQALALGEKGSVPTDAAAVIVASPKKPFGPGEKDALIKYGDEGGRLLILADPRTTTPEVYEVANHFGIEIGNNVVIDQIQRLFSAPQLGAQPVVHDYGAHPITKDFGVETVTIFNIASSVSAKGKSGGEVTYTDLLKSSATAWAETDLASLFADEPAATLDDKDIKGPVTMAVAYEKKLSGSDKGNEAKRSRVVVFGDSDWLINANINLYSNRDLFLNSVNWIVGEESSLSIRARTMRESLAPIGTGDYLKILAASFLIPEILLLLGLSIWWRRRAVFA